MARSPLIGAPRRAAALAAVALALLLTAPAVAQELPQWPHEQQAALNQVEEDVLRVQRQLFKARQRGDQAAIDALTPEYATLQGKRQQLIDVTRDQLDSE